MGGGQDKPAWTACPPGVKITRVGGKITRDSLPPGGQAVQGGKINCYTGEVSPFQVYLRKSFNNVPFRKLTTICFLKNNIQSESLKIMINRHVNFMFWTDIN